MNQLQQLQFIDKYSRWNYDEGRRETWEEAVTRASDFLRELSQNKLDESDYEMIHNAMLNMEAFSSMRLFAMAGEAGRRNNLSLYNCAALGIDSIDAFCEVMLLSMSGCGVGFSVESKFTSQLPLIATKFERTAKSTYLVPDDTEGWVNAFRTGLQHWFNGEDIEFDYSLIRPAGAVLMTKGGRASGPQPLQELLDYSRKVIRENKGKQLTPIQVHDIVTKIAGCVVSGGVRRSATISLFDETDTEMLHAKDNGWWKISPQRSNANNSVVIERKLTHDEISRYMHIMHNGGSGEPGLMARVNINRTNPQRRKDRDDWLYNPCQPGFATVLTPSGIRLFKDINIGDQIWGETGWTEVVNKWETGTKSVYRYETSFGDFVGTENHKVMSEGIKVEVKDAERIDVCSGPYYSVQMNPLDIMDGLVLGDGSVHKASNNLVYLTIGKHDMDYFESEVKHLIGKDRSVAFSPMDTIVSCEIATTISAEELPQTFDRVVPERFFYGDNTKVRGFLRGLYSANGSVVANGKRVTLKQTSLKLIKDVQVMLSSIGIRSYITTNKPSLIKWHNGDYLSKESYDLNITQDRSLFAKTVGFIQVYKQEKIKPTTINRKSIGTIKSIEYLGEHQVYDITVDNDSHTYWTGGLHVSNCAEVNLRPMQLCNLSQAIVRHDDTFQSLARKVTIATIIGTIQSMATHFPGMRPIWKQNCEEERLLGVDITGQMDNPKLLTEETFRRLRKIVIDCNRDYAQKLGINQSVATTCVKPSGNSSVLFDCSSGLHARWSPYYIRRMRVNANSPIRKMLEQSGFKLYPENGQDYETANTMVVEFPVKSPDGAITNENRTALDQLEWWKRNKIFWTEHNPSMTCTYKADELETIIDWLHDNQSIIGGLSFLQEKNDYPQMPMEGVTKRQYDKMVKELPEIDFDLLQQIEFDDRTTSATELACFGGVCTI